MFKYSAYTSNNSNAQKWVFEYINTNATGGLMQIMGTSQTTVAQMVRYYNANRQVTIHLRPNIMANMMDV